MSSAKSGINQVELYTGNTSQILRGKGSRGKNFYYTEVTLLENGGIIAETYRSDASGSNPILVRKSLKNEGENPVVTYASATDDEIRNFEVSRSALSREVINQVNEASSSAFTIAKPNETGLSQIGKNNAEIVGGGSGNSANADDKLKLIKLTSKIDFAITDKRKTTYESLAYPESIRESKQDRIVFSMFYQSGREFDFNLDANSIEKLFTFGKRNITNITGSVTLPIQGGISDRNSVQYSDSTLNALKAAGAGAVLNFGDAFSSVSKLFQDFDAGKFQTSLNNPEVKNAIAALKASLASQVVGDDIVPRTTGAILNPNLELLLQTPVLREFQFRFKMSARDRKEATQIRKIIRFFKQGMTVKKSNTSLFIVSPNQFKIQYKTGDGRDHPSIGKIKECALTSLNTNYTPDNTYMTFDDEARTMTSYEIIMNFKELTPLTEDDYLNADHDVAGTSNFLLAPELDEFVTDSSIGY